jgi:hypothetical protein
MAIFNGFAIAIVFLVLVVFSVMIFGTALGPV